MITNWKIFINEDAAMIRLSKKKVLFYYDDDARCFGFIDDEARINDTYHSKLFKDIDGKELERMDLDFPGRLWLIAKVISFYYYPPKEHFQRVLDEIKNVSDDEIDWKDGWRVEITRKKKKGGNESKLIPIDKYESSDPWSKEVVQQIHLLPPEEKKKALKKLGYKPRVYKTPKGMTQAQARSIKTKNKFTESFQKFNEQFDPWSVKRYGNAAAVYYNGAIVGFNDKEIGEEEEVQSKYHSVELVYSTDTNESETMNLYVVRSSWKLFENETDAVKQIAQKLAENIYKQGFIIKIN